MGTEQDGQISSCFFFFFSILAFLGRRELNRISKVNFLLNHLKIDREI